MCSPEEAARSARRRCDALPSISVARDDADDEAGDVVFAVGVEAGHLGRLAAEQRAAVLAAAAARALDDLNGDVGDRAARWPGSRGRRAVRALDQDVVDAVIDEIAADRVWTPVMNATRSFVPTPSALATSTGIANGPAAPSRRARRTTRCRTGRPG